MSMSDIPTDEAQYKKLLQRVSLRLFRSATWSDRQRQDWVRYYRWWRKITDAARDRQDGDEYTIFLGYAFGLVEQIHAKVTEPLLQMGIPYAVFPTKIGDGPKSDNFAQMVRNWYAKPNNQEGLRRSKKEMIICGPRWEVDEWLHLEYPGRMWGQEPREVMAPVTDPKTGRPVMRDGKPVMAKTVVMVPAEVKRQITKFYGFNTRYPSIFDMYPEPDRKTIDTGQKTDVSWIVEDLGELSVEELAREVYVDPHDGATKPLYDLTRLLHAAGKRAEERYDRIMRGDDAAGDKYGPLITPVRDWNYNSDWGRQNKDSVYPTEGTVDRAASEDKDKVWACRMHEGDDLITVANGRFIIHRKRNPYHVPGLKARVENYTQDPEFLYGAGAIAPIEDELAELNDIRSLSMSNFWRLVNKMLYIREDAIVSMDDFKSRAGGKVRIAEAAGDVRAAVQDGSQANVVNEMLAAESNERGLIESITSIHDGTPGVMGTKPYSKTARGQELIAINTNTRFITMQAQGLINEARRGLSMQDFINQFHFRKMPYRCTSDNGTTTYMEFSKDDIYTEGRPFELVIEVDPLWGNTRQQRQDSVDIFQEGVAYENLRSQLKDPQMRKVNLDLLFEDLLKKAGRRDTSRIFSMASGEVSPEDELQILMQGGVCECKGDLMHHIQTHILQLNSPALKQAMEANKVHPQTAKNLEYLIAQAHAQLRAFVANPQGAAQKKLNQLGIATPGGANG